MKKHTILGTILSAAILATAGAAMAQQQPGAGSGTGSGAGGMPNQAAPTTPGDSSVTTPRTPGAGMTSPGMPGQATAPSAMPPETVVGKDVVNAEGDTIGEISEVVGNQVIVEVGGFLGIGSRDVALDWSRITPTGTADDMKLETTLTKEELQAMPEYKK